MAEQAFEVYADPRGALLPISLDQVPFPVQRVFWVRGNDAGLERGHHRAGCEELLVLLHGTASIQHGPDPEALDTTRLGVPGATLRLAGTDYVRYLIDSSSALLVCAAGPYLPGEDR